MWDSQLCVYRVLMSFCVPCEWCGGGGGGGGGGVFLAQGPNEPSSMPPGHNRARANMGGAGEPLQCAADSQ